MKTSAAWWFSWSLGLTFPNINFDTVKDKVWERQRLCLANCWLISSCMDYNTSYLSLTSCFVVDDVLSCKDTADGETPSAASLLEGGLAGSLPQIFSCLKNLGIPSAPSHQTLVFFSLLSAVEKARKTFSLPRNSTEFQQKGKRMGTQVKLNIKSNESTKNDKRAGTAVWHRQIPQLPHFGQCPRNEETVLWAAVPVGALWQLHPQCVVEPSDFIMQQVFNQ